MISGSSSIARARCSLLQRSVAPAARDAVAEGFDGAVADRGGVGLLLLASGDADLLGKEIDVLRRESRVAEALVELLLDVAVGREHVRRLGPEDLLRDEHLVR